MKYIFYYGQSRQLNQQNTIFRLNFDLPKEKNLRKNPVDLDWKKNKPETRWGIKPSCLIGSYQEIIKCSL